ncbi:hypothetical protein R6Q57_019197 [Mikania cordata]
MCNTQTQTTFSISISATTTSPEKQPPSPPPHVQLTIDPPITPNKDTLKLIKSNIILVIARSHAGYFRITLSLCMQTLLLKTLGDPPENSHVYRKMLGAIPGVAFLLMWLLSLIILGTFTIIFILKCALLSHMVKHEYLNHIGINYLFAPSISWLLLLQSSPFLALKADYGLILYWVFVLPILILDVKIYGQWFTTRKRFLSTMANPASQLSVIGNFVGAYVAAGIGWMEIAVIMLSLGFIHYVVLFVTLYQRLSGNSCMPPMLRPVMCLFFGAPSMASLAWDSISGTFDSSSKMLFHLSIFIFLSLVSRPILFKKSMEKFNMVWWAYSYPLTLLALASIEYAQETKTHVAHLLMIVLSGLSVFVSFILMVYTALNTNILSLREGVDDNDDSDMIFPTLSPNTTNSKTPKC